MADYFKNIKDMTEAMYTENSQSKITFVCHSMGCPILSYFFNQQSQSWKDKHIHGLVSLGGAWGGAVKAMKAFASGKMNIMVSLYYLYIFLLVFIFIIIIIVIYNV